MKKFNSLICAGVLAVVGLVGVCDSARAADKNIQVNEYSVDTLGTRCLDIVFFNTYTENAVGEIFSGSSTTSGGTSTFSNGMVNIAGWTDAKYFGAYFSPTTAGSNTVTFYGIFGTTTAGAGTSNASILITTPPNPYTYASTTATSTAFTCSQNPTMLAVSVNVTSGTMATFLGMHTNKAK